MTEQKFIIELFDRIDAAMQNVKKHSQSRLYPSEIVTIGVLFVLKRMSQRAFYRWLSRNYQEWFPNLPERTRLFRQITVHQDWTQTFLAEPTLLGIADSYGMELIHPKREGRSKKQIGKKGKSNHRWIVGVKFLAILNSQGLIVSVGCLPANQHDKHFHPWIEALQERMAICADSGFHAREGDPPNLKICQRGTWNGRMLVETVFSLLTQVCQLKKATQRVWKTVHARCAYMATTCNLLLQWNGRKPDGNGKLHLSMAEFIL